MKRLFLIFLLTASAWGDSFITEPTLHFVGGSGTKAGDANAGGGCTVATFSGDATDYFGTNGAALYNNAACSLSDSGSSVMITSEGNFGTDIVVGTLVNVDFAAAGEFTDGVYEITAVTDANSVTIDLTWAASGDTAEVWVGGAFTDVYTATNNEDSTDVVDDDGAFHHRYIMTNKDETISTSIEPEGGNRGSSKFVHIIGYNTKIHVETVASGLYQVLSDMDVGSYSGPYADNFSTSYYGGSIEAIRKVENGAYYKRPNADWIQWDADDNAIDVITVAGDNTQFRNIYAFNTDKSANADCVYASAAREGSMFINCWFDVADDRIAGANLDEAVFLDCYFGADVDDTDLASLTSTLFSGCVFNGNSLTVAADNLDDCSVLNCLFYAGGSAVGLSTGTSRFLNSIFYGQTTQGILADASTQSCAVYNNIFSPVAVADYACYAGDDGTLIGSNNIAYSVTAGAALTTPYYNNGESAAFSLPNTIEEDPQFIDAANFDFRSKNGLFKGLAGFDPDQATTNIGSSNTAKVIISNQ